MTRNAVTAHTLCSSEAHTCTLCSLKYFQHELNTSILLPQAAHSLPLATRSTPSVDHTSFFHTTDSNHTMEVFWAAPPVTRTLVAAAVITSLSAWGIGIPSIYRLVFVSSHIFTIKKLPELWRLFTPFLITGPQFGLLLDPYFLWTYGKALETESSRFKEPGSYAVFLAFAGVTILVSSNTTGFRFHFTSRPLLRALCAIYFLSFMWKPRNICPPSVPKPG